MISKRKIVKWNQSSGGLLFPEELEMIEKVSLGLADRMKIDGFLSIFQYPADDEGNPIREKGVCLDAGFNLIVTSGRAAAAAMERTTAAAIVTAGIYDLGLLAVGDGSGGGAGHTPLPADVSLVNERTDPLGGPVVSGVPRPTMQVTTLPPGPPFFTNLWTAQIGTTQLNGVIIDEAGIYCLDDTTLSSYRTFPGQTKANGYVMEWRWSRIY